MTDYFCWQEERCRLWYKKTVERKLVWITIVNLVHNKKYFTRGKYYVNLKTGLFQWKP